MYDYRVPTVQVEAEVLCADGVTLTGFVFMPEQSAVHAGRMRPAEWVNRRIQFFPFRPGGGREVVLLNKRQVVAIGVPADAADDETLAGLQAPTRGVVVEAAGRSFEGHVVIDMPENQQRVVDYLNGDEAFVHLHARTRDYFVHKVHVSRVREAEGEA